MSDHDVLIVSSNGLFREALKHVLAGTPNLAHTSQVSSLQEAEELMQMGQTDIVIYVLGDTANGQEIYASAITSLLSRPGVRVIVVSLDGTDISVYRREQIEEASVEDLLAALFD